MLSLIIKSHNEKNLLLFDFPMKKQVLITLLSFFSLSGLAQLNDYARLVVNYASQFKFRQENPKLFEDEQILEIGTHYSAYYGLWNTRRADIKDSITARGGSYSEIMQALAQSGYPLSKQGYAVYKNYPQKGKLTYTDVVFKKFRYTETIDKPVWKILPGDTLIYKYPCQKAQTVFRGRTWIVWFTSSIPISDGPWKLHGLPGLILNAQDSTGDFSFRCIGLKKGGQTMVRKPEGKFIECTPQKLARMHTQCAKNPETFLQNFGISGMASQGPDGKPIVYKEEHPVLLEIIP